MGVRFGSRFHICINLHPDMSIEEVEKAREEARRLLRRLEDEESIPGLARGRSMTLRDLCQEFMTDFRENRGASRSPQTLKSYQMLWRVHILPTLGHLRIAEITTEVVRRFKREIPDRVLERRPETKGGGRTVANRALQQLNAALDFAYRMEWITRNPASGRLVPRFEESRAEDFLDHQAYAAIGKALRDFEGRLARGQTSPLSLRTLNALRLAITTSFGMVPDCLRPTRPTCWAESLRRRRRGAR
jgi:hypothetical protein